MSTPVTAAEQYVRQLLQTELTPDHCYHNLPHTLAVVESCRLLCARHGLPVVECEVLELSAWFHDTGFSVIYEGHEEESARIAGQFLEGIEYPRDQIETVKRCVLATLPTHEPEDLLEKIIRDADLSNLGRADYLAMLSGLRHEWSIFRGEDYTDQEWYDFNHQFVKKYTYTTAIATELYDLQRRENQRTLKRLAGKKKKKKKKSKVKDGPTIATNRNAQIMFRTALRNHMDLSSLADNKANIMLSVNALIVTIAVPMAAGYVTDAPHLMAPVIVLLLTCLCSMIFATLATRPAAMSGYTSGDEVREGKANLFFFGNFYRMNVEAYFKGMDELIAQGHNLESAIKRDLFFLGKSLGRKYNQLRICYSLFMIGVILSVIMFGISYLVFN